MYLAFLNIIIDLSARIAVNARYTTRAHEKHSIGGNGFLYL